MSSRENDLKHIAIAGNIGAGKTTLTSLLANHYGWQPHFEDADDNPYLSDFYSDMERWAFNLQIHFLNQRFKQLQSIQNGSNTIIQDRTIYEDAYIFAPNLHEMNLMSTRDFNNYQDLFSTMLNFIKAPNLLIYLKGDIPKLVSNIHDRGRDYEGSMSLDYLKKLNKRYNDWIKDYKSGPLLIIDINNIDFKNNPSDLGIIIDRIDAELNGLF